MSAWNELVCDAVSGFEVPQDGRSSDSLEHCRRQVAELESDGQLLRR